MKKAILNIDGYIGNSDIISMFSGERNFSLSMLKDFLAGLESDVTDIQIFINSGGGSVIEGWAIFDKLKASGKKITTIGEGIVGSIATVIFMAGSDRKLHENTSFFIHNPYWSPDGPIPMEAGDLAKLSEELKQEETKILDFYAKATGTDISIIEPLMKDATSLTSQQAIELGFANSIITEEIQARKYKIAACVNIKQNNNKMEQTKLDKAIATMEAWGKKFENLFKKNFKNMDVTGTNAAGDSVNLYIESENTDFVDKNVFVIDSGGNQIPAPDDTYTLQDGTVITVASGIITDAKMPQANSTDAEKLAAAQAKIDALNSEKAALEASITEKDGIINELKASTNELRIEFENVKQTVIGAGIEFKSMQTNGKVKDIIKTGKSAYFDSISESIKH